LTAVAVYSEVVSIADDVEGAEDEGDEDETGTGSGSGVCVLTETMRARAFGRGGTVVGVGVVVVPVGSTLIAVAGVKAVDAVGAVESGGIAVNCGAAAYRASASGVL
jgi:hypothetical protein